MKSLFLTIHPFSASFKSPAVVFLLLLSSFSPLNAQWEKRDSGMDGARVKALAAGSTYLFAGTDGAGIFRSGDQGNSWQAVNEGITDFTISSLAVSGSYVFAGTDKGLFRSTNNGASWVQLNVFTASSRVEAIMVGNGYVFASSRSSSGLVRSPDNGDTWEPANVGLANARSFFIDGSNLYAGGYDEGIYKSSDNGEIWAKMLTTGSGFYVHAIVENGGVIIAGGVGGIYRSIDDGINWTNVGGGSVLSLTVSGAYVFAGTSNQGVKRSADNGATWTNTSSGLENLYPTDHNNYIFYAMAAVGGNVFAGGEFSSLYGLYGSFDFLFSGGIYKSTNQGASWVASNNGLGGMDVTCFESANGYVFAGTIRGVFRSVNMGLSWELANNGLGSQIITALFAQGGYLFVGTLNKGVFRSADNGATWTEVNSGLVDGALQVKCFAAKDGYLFRGGGGGNGSFIHRTSNNGTSWEVADIGLQESNVIALAATETHLYAAVGSYVYRSTNNGSSWPSSSRPDNINFSGITSLTVIDNELFAGTSTGSIYRSIDNGNTWTSSITGFTSAIYSLTANSNILFGANPSAGVFTSANKSYSWRTINNGLEGNMKARSVLASSNHLYAGLHAGGVFVTDLNLAAYAPTITYFNPSVGEPGTSVVITGTNFSTTNSVNEISFNGGNGFANSSTETSITVQVPSDATSGKITVTVAGVPVVSTQDFTMYAQQPLGQPSILSAATGSQLQVNLSFPAATSISHCAGYVILRRQDGTNPNVTGIVDGIAPASLSLPAGTTLAGVISSNSITSFASTGLSPATQYNYLIVPYNLQTGQGYNYNLGGTLRTASATTFAAEPTAQPTALTFSTFTSSSLTGNFTAAVGSPSGYLVLRRLGASPTGIPNDGQTYTSGSSSIGDGLVVFVGTSTTFNDAGLAASTEYFYDVFAYNGSGNTINYRTATPLEGGRITLATEPSAQPTTLNFTLFSTTSLNGNFTAASGASGYLILRRHGSSPTSVPNDGQTYAANGLIGDGTIVAVGTGTTFSDVGLSSNTFYHYDIFAFNGSGAAINYRIVSPLEGSRSTLALEPTAQPTAFIFNSLNSTSLSGSFTSASGNPAGYLVLRRLGASPTGLPADGQAYLLGSALGDGTVVSVSSNTTFNDTGLSTNTIYHYLVFAYNGSGEAINYRTIMPLGASQTTIAPEPSSQATALNFTTIMPTTLGASFTPASGSPTGYLVLRRQGASPTSSPMDGTPYSINSTIGDGTVVAMGSSTSFNDVGLAVSTVYHYDIFAYNGSGTTINYNTVNPFEGNRSTLALEPTAQPTGLIFSNHTTTGLRLAFNVAAGSPTGYLIVRKVGSPSGVPPADGQAYSLGPELDGTIVFIGNSSQFDDAGLTSGTIYHYTVYSFNGVGQAINYLTLPVGLSGSTITLPDVPIALAATQPQQTSITANWSSVTGAVNYQVEVSLDNFTTLLSGYNPKVVTSTSEVISGLSSGITYQYRVRATNASGFSMYSNTINQITVPATPIAEVVSSPGANDFVARWNSISGAESYELDVSTNNFITLLPNYNPRQVPGTLTQETVVGLSPGTQYQYRVRAKNAGGLSPSSNTVPVTTTTGGGSTPLTISQINFNSLLGNGVATVPVTVEIAGGNGNKNVEILQRAITATAFSAPIIPTSISGNTYTFNLPVAGADELGIEFFVRAQDVSTTTNSTSRFIYRSINPNTVIPGLSFGGRPENYRIISIPYKLDQSGVSDIFPPSWIGDNTKMRLIRYVGTGYDDVKSGNLTIGLGYWFNARETTTITLGEGNVSQNNQSSPFILNLQQGWNMVATPYPFVIDWSDIVDANPAATVDQVYYTFNPNINDYDDDNNSLKPYEGGFVFAANATTLEIPVTLKNTAGGRKHAVNDFQSDIDAENWLVSLKLKQGGLENTRAAIGMHLDADLSKDNYDRVALPGFLDYVELTSHHSEFFAPYFSRDIVPQQESYMWTLNFEASRDEAVEISWDNSGMEGSEAQLLLYDPVGGVLTDMRKSNKYLLPNGTRRELQVIYSRKGFENLIGDLSKPYPNPFKEQVKLPAYFNAQGNTTKLEVKILNMTGDEVYQQHLQTEQQGLIQPEWLGVNLKHESVPAGMYIYKIIYQTGSGTISKQGKIIKI